MYFHRLLKIRNWKQPFACFQFPSQIEFWKQFLFSARFELPNKFFSLKNRKLFLKTENNGKKQLPIIFWMSKVCKREFLFYKKIMGFLEPKLSLKNKTHEHFLKILFLFKTNFSIKMLSNKTSFPLKIMVLVLFF